MSDRHDGDFKGVDISRLLEGFREKLEHSRRPYLLTDQDRSAASDLKALLRELENLTAAKQPSRQAILEQTWERIRHRIGAGGVVLNYTGVDDPYNIVNLAWAGSEGMLSADGRLKMWFGRDFIKGHLTFQGPDYDPMPALDIEQELNDSYFQTDVLDNTEINEMDDYLQLMQPYGIEDWMGTIVDRRQQYGLVLLPFFYRRTPARERRRVRHLMQLVAPELAKIFSWAGFSGDASVSGLLSDRNPGTGTVLLDFAPPTDDAPAQMNVTYDHAATELVETHLPYIHDIDHLIRRIAVELGGHYTLTQGYRDVSQLTVFAGELEAEAKVDHIRDRKIIRVNLRSQWKLTDAQRRWLGKRAISPEAYKGTFAGFVHYKTQHLKHVLRRRLVDGGNVTALGTREDQLLLMAEPVISKTVTAAMSNGTRPDLRSARAFRDTFHEIVRQDLQDPNARIFLYDADGIFAVLQKARGHRLFDEARRFVQEYLH